MRFNLIVLIVIFFVVIGAKEKDKYKEKDLVVWSDENKIIWKNYKGKPTNSTDGAMTCSLIYSKYENSNNNDLIINIRACFLKNESWKREKMPSNYHLNHEQRHFDITEIFARRLRKILADTSFQSISNAKKNIPKLIKDNNKEWDIYQNIYDKESNHSINIEKQTLWNKRIDDELNQLSDYKSNLISIKEKSAPDKQKTLIINH